MEKLYKGHYFILNLNFETRWLLCFLHLLLFFFIPGYFGVRAEGTKELQPSPTNNGFIQIFDMNTLTRPFATYNCPVDNRLNIHVSAIGEKVYMGFNQPNNDVYFRVKDPLGNIVMGPLLLPAVGAGFIPSHGQAVAGPNVVAAGGYLPLSFLPALTGDYYIEFNPVSPTVISPSKRVFTYIDITVVSAANTVLPGRLYSKSWDFQTNSGTNPFVANLYIYTPDGVVSGLDLNGIMPYGFVVSSNSTGCTKTGNFINDRKSEAGNVNYPEFKIFLNDPDISAYPTGAIGNITAPSTITGCFPGPYCINVTTNANGSGNALLDLNGTLGYQAGTTDVLIGNNVVSGKNCIAWDGKDGLGNPVAAGTIISVNVSYLFGLTNLPIYDAEYHPNGYKVFSVRPAAPTPLMMWDDGLIGGTTNLTGCAGNTGCHGWPVSGAGFGNNNTINTWWYINTAIDNTMLIVPDLTLNTSVVNAMCNGAIPGSATVVPSGGKGPYSYVWNTNPVQKTATATNLSIGTYSVVVTDANGCGANKTSLVSIVVTPNPTVQAGPDISVCPATGKVQLKGVVTIASGGRWSGGTGTFLPSDTTLNATYTLSTAELISGVANLTLTSTHNGPCAPVADQLVIKVTSPLLAAINPQNPAICFGQTVTSLTGSGSGGSAPYSYLWNNVNPAATLNVGVGTYTLKVTDALGCQASANTTVTSFSSPTVAKAGVDQTRCRQSPVTALKGSITGASGGIWSGGSGNFSPSTTALSVSYTPSASELNNGFADLILTTTGSGTCPSGSDTARINYVDFTGIVSDSVTNVKCFGGTTGSVKTVISGGSAPYVYFWNTVPPQTGSIANNLAVGSYALTITNSIGCIYQTTVTITQPPPLSVSATVVPVNCNGTSTGSVQISPVGGTMPYSYLWLPGNQTTAAITEKAGNYSVTVTDAKGCQVTGSYTLQQPAPLAISFTHTDLSCFNAADGTATATVTGGIPSYSFNWNSGGTAASLTGLGAGLQQLTVTDAKGCIATGSVVVAQPGLLTTKIAVTNITCSYLSNGSALGTTTGGTSPYFYSWKGGQTTAALSGQTAGTYQLTATDAKGCKASAVAVITAPPLLDITFEAVNNVNCFGGSDGSVIANAIGGTPNYSYSWAPSGSTSNTLSGVGAGTHTLTLRDSKNCSRTSSVTITQPAQALSITASAQPATCNALADGSVSTIASGGTGPYIYSWTPGGQLGASRTNLKANNYAVNVTDSRGCVAGSVAMVTEPAALVLKTTVVNSDCGQPNGSSTVSVSGGVGNYTYLWTPSGSTKSSATGLLTGAYSVVVTDGNGCTADATGNVNENTAAAVSISNITDLKCYGDSSGSAIVHTSGGMPPFTYTWFPYGGNDTIARGLVAGSYTVFVTGFNGCKSLATTIPAISQPDSLSLSITTTPALCFSGSDGSATASSSGGTPNYTYLWLPGGSAGSVLSGMQAGMYTVKVKDKNNCVKSMNYTIMQPKAALSVTLAAKSISCNGGSDGKISTTTSGGTGGYTFSWTPGNSTGPFISNVSSGIYKVIVKDANGCQTKGDSITVLQPAQPLSFSISTKAASCFGSTDGIGKINGSGGTPGYSYNWFPSGGTSAVAPGLAAGNYSVLLKDTNGCNATAFININQPAPLAGSLEIGNASCGFANGTLKTRISGGTGSYSYFWSPGSAVGASLLGLTPGVYTVMIKDSLQCPLSLSAQLINIPGPDVGILSQKDVACSGGNSGAATLSVVNGTGPYQIKWSPYGGDSLKASGLIAGQYEATVWDGLGCKAVALVNIKQPQPLNSTIVNLNNVLCFGENSGSAALTATGGTPGYFYNWSGGNPQDSSFVKGLTAGLYTVALKDKNNCSISKSFLITQPEKLLASKDSSANSVCFNGTGMASVKAEGGTLPYKYAWTAPVEKEVSNRLILPAGAYTTTVTDANGCTAMSKVLITQPSQVITTAGPNDTLCIGKTGVMTAFAKGGHPPYYFGWQPTGEVNSGKLKISPKVSTTYNVIAYDSGGCPGTSDSAVAIVYDLSAANVTLTGATPICPGVGTTIMAHVSGSTGPVTYSWNKNLGSGPGGFDITPLKTTTYSVVVSNSCGVIIKDSIQIQINPQPQVALTPSTDAGCIPIKVNFTDQSIRGNPADSITSWIWNFGDNTGSILQNPSHTYSSSGEFPVVLTVETAGGCKSQKVLSPMVFHAYPIPIAAFTVNSTELNLPMDYLQCTNLSRGANQYDWSFGDGATSIVENPRYMYSSIGVYDVVLTAKNEYGCSNKAQISLTTKAEFTFPNAFTPNTSGPSGGAYDGASLNNDVFFPYTSGVVDYKLQIFNRWGELIFESSDVKIGWDGYYRGQLCQQDVYVYKAYVKLNNGKTVNKNGDVTLIK